MKQEAEKSADNKEKSTRDLDNGCSLILYNDDYHTFEYVIDALMEICKMERIQAVQCTYLIHYREKCEIKKGTKQDLLPMRRALAGRDLKAAIH